MKKGFPAQAFSSGSPRPDLPFDGLYRAAHAPCWVQGFCFFTWCPPSCWPYCCRFNALGRAGLSLSLGHTGCYCLGLCPILNLALEHTPLPPAPLTCIVRLCGFIEHKPRSQPPAPHCLAFPKKFSLYSNTLFPTSEVHMEGQLWAFILLPTLARTSLHGYSTLRSLFHLSYFPFPCLTQPFF
jgi:hypothetical protein